MYATPLKLATTELVEFGILFIYVLHKETVKKYLNAHTYLSRLDFSYILFII